MKIQKKKIWGGGGRGRGWVWGVRVDVIEELKSFWENSQKKKFSGGVCLGGGGVRVDVNEELKFLCKLKKKKNGGGSGGVGLGGGGGGGSGWMRTKN